MEQNPQLSKELFSEGLALKRSGRYHEAVYKYQQSIIAYTDSPELNNSFYALGKALYLDGQYEKSLKAYTCYLACTIVPEMIHDYKSALGNYSVHEKTQILYEAIIRNRIDESIAFAPLGRLIFAFTHPCAHFGHSGLDDSHRNEAPDVVENYRKSIAGIDVADDNWENSDYHQRCRRAGMAAMCNIIEEYINDEKVFTRNIAAIMRELVYDKNPSASGSANTSTKIAQTTTASSGCLIQCTFIALFVIGFVFLLL